MPSRSAPMPAANSRRAAAPIFSRRRDMRLLVTRPAPDGERTAAVLRARGHEVLLLPLLRVEFIPDAPLGPGPWDGVLMTSANAARALAVHRQREQTTRDKAYV